MRQRGCYRRKELPGGNGALALGVGISFVLILVFFLIFLQVDPLGNGEKTVDGSWDTELYAPRGDLKEKTAELFPAVDALIFVGACGIAVRAVASHVVSKTSDPAVLVLSERGAS